MSESHLFLAGRALLALCLLTVWVSGRRSVRRPVKGVREVTRAGGTVSRTLVAGAVIVGVQWLVLRFDNDTATWIALGVPALFAGVTVARLFAVTEIVHTTRKGGGRR